MIPTLKMFATTASKDPEFLNPIYAVVRQFHALGGDLIFGTDVGYMTDYSTADEFKALADSGLNYRDMLRMLTVAPAARFGVTASKGTITPGKMADSSRQFPTGDPATDIEPSRGVHCCFSAAASSTSAASKVGQDPGLPILWRELFSLHDGFSRRFPRCSVTSAASKTHPSSAAPGLPHGARKLPSSCLQEHVHSPHTTRRLRNARSPAFGTAPCESSSPRVP